MDLRWTDYPTLHESRERSLQALETLTQSLEQELGGLPELPLIAASGSLGRLEVRTGSDCDLIIVIPAGLRAADVDSSKLAGAIHRAILKTGLTPSDPTGIFAESIHAHELTDPAHRGEVTENMERFGKRIQLLLDSRPVLRGEEFQPLLENILDFYGAGPHSLPQGTWAYLLNDLIRYYRTYSVWRQWDFRTGGGGWTLRNLKLNSSRLLMVAGLLLLLGESTCKAEPVEWVLDRLNLTPLERIATVFAEYSETDFLSLVEQYERFQSQFFNASLRRELAEASPTSPEDFPLQTTDLYHQMNAPLNRIRHQLVRFLLDRQTDWDVDFVAGLLL